MKVEELIKLLSELPSGTPIYVWCDGERLEIETVDLVNSYADINVKELWTMNNKPKLTDRLYTTGMQFADCLRLLGKHEESHEVEVWVLGMVLELISKAGK